eukprot:5739128-Pyramimonas_sp.AAC.1
MTNYLLDAFGADVTSNLGPCAVRCQLERQIFDPGGDGEGVRPQEGFIMITARRSRPPERSPCRV